MSLATEIAGKLNYLNIQDKNTINALAPYSGYMKVSKKLDNFVFQTSSSFLNKVADKNRFVKFGDRVVDTYGPELIMPTFDAWLFAGCTVNISGDSKSITLTRTGTETMFVYASGGATGLNIGSAYRVITRSDSPDSHGYIGALVNSKDYIYTAISTIATIYLQVPAGSIGDKVTFNLPSVREIQTAQFTVPDVAEVITNGSNTTSVSVNAGDYVVVDKEELVTNGDFSDGTTNWQNNTNGGIFDTSSGYMHCVTSTTSNEMFEYTINNILYGSTTYIIKYEIVNTSSPNTNIYNDSTGSLIGVIDNSIGIHTIKYTPSATTNFRLIFRGAGGSTTLNIDNISVRRVSDTFRATRDTADMYDYISDNTNVTINTYDVVKYLGNGTGGISGNYYMYIGGTQTLSLVGLNYTASYFTDLGTASSMSLSNPFWEDRTELGVTNQALAYHAYNTLTNAYEGIKTEVLFSDVSKADLLDNSVWMARNGFSKVSQFLYSKGSYLCLPVCIWQSLNKGAYMPFGINPFGTKPVLNTSLTNALPWYDANVFTLSTIADTFGSKVPSAGNWGNIGGGSGRPDSKFYDIVYPDQFIDVREYAKIVNRDEVKLLVDDKEQWGVEESVKTIRANGGINSSFFRGYWAAITPTALALHYSTDIGMPISDSDAILKYKTWNCVVIQGQVYIGKVTGVVIAGDSHLIFTCLENHNLNQGFWGTDAEVIATTTKPILSSGTKLSIDLIGNPTNYPQIMKDRLASGVGVVGINPLLVGQDGTSYTLVGDGTYDWIIGKKSLSTTIPLLYSLSNGEDWALHTKTVNTITNNITGTISSGWLSLISYTSKNHPYIQTTPKPVLEVNPKVIASNDSSIYKGCMITAQITGKIPTGS